jgi:uncharacterized DUF497 family protein
MEYRIELAPEVVARACERFDWIAVTSPERAEKWYRGLIAKIETLKTHPKRCPVAAESQAYGEQLRYLTYGRRGDVFRVFFTIRDDMIRVIGLHHAAQGPFDF